MSKQKKQDFWSGIAVEQRKKLALVAVCFFVTTSVLGYQVLISLYRPQVAPLIMVAPENIPGSNGVIK